MNTAFFAGATSPSWTFLGVEPFRAALEYARMHMMDKSSLPAGDGHPVVIFPGLASDQNSIGPLKDFCRHIGYTAYDWGRGCNVGPKGNQDEWIEGLAQTVSGIYESHSQEVSLVGWSLGGIYAREVAKKIRSRVRQVITIGTPFAGTAAQSNLEWVYRKGSDHGKDSMGLCSAPDVPTSSIFSRSDGVVAWQACIHDGRQRLAENIEVDGSHCGLGWNPEVLTIIADRLRHTKKSWKRHARSSHPLGL
jgi:hypothetical protein